MSRASQANANAARWQIPIALSCLSSLTLLIYWPGLAGPFLLDDTVNLAVVREWLERDGSSSSVLFSTTASPFGRPLAMASFALSAWLGGFTPHAFKLGNLLVHIACGTAVYGTAHAIAATDRRLAPSAQRFALVIAAIWLLHPLQASTVLYSVQRMAQLSTLFMLGALWLYVAMRSRLETGDSRPAAAAMLIGVPALALTGFLAKENALLVPALCLVLELGCFRSPSGPPRSVRIFFAFALLFPAVVGIALAARNPDYVLGAYTMRDFTLLERMLTQPRVLCDYLLTILAPAPLEMGVYTDGFAPSRGLWAPPSTSFAILFLAAVSWAAVRWRRPLPSLFIGWGLFLVGHAMEASVLPLELYFEHRNYLPMVGVLYALGGMALSAVQGFPNLSRHGSVPGAALVVAALAILALGTYGRARAWSSEASLVEAAVAAHPESMRAQLAVVDAAVRMENRDRAEGALEEMTRSENERVRALGFLNRINLRCALARAADEEDLRAAVRNAPSRITMDEPATFSLLMSNTRNGCRGIDNAALARAASAYADAASTQPDQFVPKAELRQAAAQFFARSGDWEQALVQARLSWQPGMPAAASVVLIKAQIALGDLPAAEETFRQAQARARPYNAGDAAGLRWLRERIDSARAQVAPDAAIPSE